MRSNEADRYTYKQVWLHPVLRKYIQDMEILSILKYIKYSIVQIY